MQDIQNQLLLAVENRQTKQISDLLENFKFIDDIKNNQDVPLLMSITMMGDIELLNLCLERSVNIDQSDTRHGGTPLMAAAQQGNLEALSILAQAGADINKQNKDGDTALHLAVWYRRHEIIKKLLNNNIVNAINKDHNTLLHLAAFKGYNEIVELLINSNVDINKINLDYNTPLHLAAHNGHKNVVNTLLQVKAKVDLVNRNEDTPLHLAAYQGYITSTKILIENGSEINKQNRNGNTPLHLAAIQGHQEIIKVLIQFNADYKIYNREGATSEMIIKQRQQELFNLGLAEAASDLMPQQNHIHIMV